jgi:hypothetical protein
VHSHSLYPRYFASFTSDFLSARSASLIFSSMMSLSASFGSIDKAVRSRSMADFPATTHPEISVGSMVMANSINNPSSEALNSAGFADSLTVLAKSQGVRSEDLFIAFVGLVSSEDAILASRCLLALEGAIGVASVRTDAPPA